MTKITHIAALVIFSLCINGCASNNEDTRKEHLASVFTFRPEGNTNIYSTYHTSSVEEGRSVSAAFKTGGQIRKLVVDEGDHVTKGQIIGYIDDTDYKLSMQQLETQYNQLSSEVKRIEEMHRRKNVSDNDYEKAMAGLNQLRIQLELTKNRLDYTRLEAPVSGIVVTRSIEEGEMVGEGTPVFRILDNSGVEAEVALSAKSYSMRDRIIKCVGKSSVTGDREIPLDIINFIPDGDSNSLFRLRLKIPDAYRRILLPGMNMSVEIFYDSASDKGVSRVPSRALFEREGKTYVWEVSASDSLLTARRVDIIGVPDGKYSLVTGLDDAGEIVAVGVHHLNDNQKVKVIGNVDNLKDKAAL